MKLLLIILLISSFACMTVRQAPPKKKEPPQKKSVLGLKIISRNSFKTDKDFWDSVDSWIWIFEKKYGYKILVKNVYADVVDRRKVTAVNIWWWKRRKE